MATNPAHVTASTRGGKPSGRSEVFEKALRTLPPTVSMKYLQTRLLGQEHFKTKKDLSHAVIYAQAKGLLSKRRPDKQMVNRASQNGSATAAAATEPQHAPRSASVVARRAEDPKANALEKGLRILLIASEMAHLAREDESITKEELVDMITKAGDAFHLAGAFRALHH
jgi:hypothetical protein